jgi:hypothetical protein
MTFASAPLGAGTQHIIALCFAYFDPSWNESEPQTATVCPTNVTGCTESPTGKDENTAPASM